MAMGRHLRHHALAIWNSTDKIPLGLVVLLHDMSHILISQEEVS